VSIVGQVVVESRRYSGWIDPRYPIGYWQAALSVTGDVTGGTLGIDLVFQPAVGPNFLNSQMYSVERFSISSGGLGSATVVRLRATNMGGPSNLGFQNEYAITLELLGASLGNAGLTRDLAFLPWFLGSQRSPGTTAALSLATGNVDDVAFRLEAEGYRWSARSVLVDGGPQRPPTGLYRA